MRAGGPLLVIAAVAIAGVWLIATLARQTVQPPETRRAAEPAAALPSPALKTPASSLLPPLPTPAPEAPTPPADSPLAANAEKAEAVNRLLASAQQRFAAGDLPAAREDMETALRLDPNSAAARTGIQRVKSQIAAEEFRRLMAEGFAALNAGDLARARSRFRAAQGVRPEATEAAEALAQTESRQRTLQVEGLRAKAAEDEAREDWAAALAAYTEVLTLEPNLQFALQGRARASALAALEERVAFFVNQPQALNSDAQLENAERLLSDIRSAPQPGVRLRAEADRLAALVQAAKTPVPVRIESDGLTEVSVLRVGRLGRLSTRELNLRPGRYTAVGARDGYRDERIEFTVAPGSTPVQLTIQCKEKV
jgi:tetratricopeptide (TPR) repeat protein